MLIDDPQKIGRRTTRASDLSTVFGKVSANWGAHGWRRIRVRFQTGRPRRQSKWAQLKTLKSFCSTVAGREVSGCLGVCCASIDRRASLVPTVAVNPAPKVYAHVVAVEKLVVGNKLFAIRTLAKGRVSRLKRKVEGNRRARSKKAHSHRFEHGRPAWTPSWWRFHIESHSQVALKKLKWSGQVDAKTKLGPRGPPVDWEQSFMVQQYITMVQRHNDKNNAGIPSRAHHERKSPAEHKGKSLIDWNFLCK